MTGKVFKEIIIMLITALVAMLLFAVVFYEFIPSRKIVPEVTEYAASNQVKELLADDVENRNDQVVLTYKVTGSDLNNYKVTKDYVPGKANPFAPPTEDPEANVIDNSPGGGGNTPADGTPGGNVLK